MAARGNGYMAQVLGNWNRLLIPTETRTPIEKREFVYRKSDTATNIVHLLVKNSYDRGTRSFMYEASVYERLGEESPLDILPPARGLCIRFGADLAVLLGLFDA